MDELRCALEWREDDSRSSPGRLVGTLIEYELARRRPRRGLQSRCARMAG